MTHVGTGTHGAPFRALPASSLLLLPALAGCGTLGPGSISRDRLAKDDMVTESWKRRMLLDLVKRYGDAPLVVHQDSATVRDILRIRPGLSESDVGTAPAVTIPAG